MKIKNLYFLVILIAVCHIFASYSSGPASAVGEGYTGAPGETGLVCGTCHAGGSYGTTSQSLEIRNTGGSIVTEYIPGATYTVNLIISNTSGTPNGYGFQMTSFKNADNTSIGTWQNPSANVKFSNAGTKIYAEHNGGFSPSNTFTMEWVAPALGTGSVNFYHIGNAVNGNGGTDMDNGGFGSSLTLTETSLPVELTSFQAEKRDQSILLSWETASEINNRGFQIEHSDDGENFKLLEWVEGTGNSSERQIYQFVDDSPSLGINYYRLLQMDFDGKSSYSDIETILFESYFNFEIYPNPAKELVFIKLFTNKTQDININIFSTNGQLVMSKTSTVEKGDNTISIPTHELSNGVYIVSIIHDNKVKNIKLNVVN